MARPTCISNPKHSLAHRYISNPDHLLRTAPARGSRYSGKAGKLRSGWLRQGHTLALPSASHAEGRNVWGGQCPSRRKTLSKRRSGEASCSKASTHARTHAHARAHTQKRMTARAWLAWQQHGDRSLGKRETSMFGIERRAQSPASAASRICSEIKTSMITREKRAWLWSRVGACARLPIDTLRQPASCEQTPRTLRGMHLRAKSSAGPVRATESPRARPGYACGRLARVRCGPGTPWTILDYFD